MKTGLVYDPVYLEHDTGQHVENALRLEAVAALAGAERPQEATHSDSTRAGFSGGNIAGALR